MLTLLLCYLLIGAAQAAGAMLDHFSNTHEPHQLRDFLVALPVCLVIYACVWPWAMYIDLSSRRGV